MASVILSAPRNQSSAAAVLGGQPSKIQQQWKPHWWIQPSSESGHICRSSDGNHSVTDLASCQGQSGSGSGALFKRKRAAQSKQCLHTQLPTSNLCEQHNPCRNCSKESSRWHSQMQPYLMDPNGHKWLLMKWGISHGEFATQKALV